MKKGFIVFGILLIIGLFVFAGSVSAEDIYIAQNSNGLSSGVNCVNSHSVLWFNTATNWVNPKQTGKIGPGDIVHLCGIINTSLQTMASGTISNPITIKFESGAKLSKPAWGIGTSAAISITGENNIVIDGDSVGIIESTDNGNLLGNSQASNGVDIGGGSEGITIKNLIIRNMYVADSVDGGTVAPSAYGYAIYALQAKDLTISNNIISHGGKVILISYRGADSNVVINGNILSNCVVGITVGSIGSGAQDTLDGLYIYDNIISLGENWNGCWSGCTVWHHQDGIHIFAKQRSDNSISNIKIYNNTIGPSNSVYTSSIGELKSCVTAWLYTEGNPGTINAPLIYNNVFYAEAGNKIGPNGAYWYLKYTLGAKFYNNVISGNGVWNGILLFSDSGAEIKNNIFYKLTTGISTAVALTSDYNDFYDVTNIGYLGGNKQTLLTAWQTSLGGCPGSGNDCNSITNDPLFIDSQNNNFYLQSSSPTIDNGTDLLAYFTTDKDGISRPQGFDWDIGAYEYVSTSTSSCGDADTSGNSIIEITELINYISAWKSGSVGIGDLITAIGEWKSGC